MTDVYYKIFISDQSLITVCLQDFDEVDYDKTKWLCDTKFESEDDAQAVIDGIHKYLGQNMLFRF